MATSDFSEMTFLYSHFWAKFEIYMAVLACREEYLNTDIPYLHAPLSNYSVEGEGREVHSEDFCVACGEYLLWAKAFCRSCNSGGIILHTYT